MPQVDGLICLRGKLVSAVAVDCDDVVLHMRPRHFGDAPAPFQPLSSHPSPPPPPPPHFDQQHPRRTVRSHSFPLITDATQKTLKDIRRRMSTSSGRSSAASSSNSSLSKRPIDPITRTALRYTLSPSEYELLHNYLISRAPQRVQKRTPNPTRYEKITKSSTESEDYNVASVRAALRVFGGLFAALKSMDLVMAKVAQKRGVVASSTTPAGPRYKNTRIALSFSAMLFFHRILHRFFIRLRAELQSENAEPFRTRNPRISQALMSKFTPAVGASLAGFCLGATPAEQLRVTIAIYIFSRSLEYGYNHASSSGLIWGKGKDRPWWFGSWLIMPFACAQLLHAFVFDRDCFPESMGAFILKRSPEYIQLRPKDYPIGRSWPGTFDIVDGLAEVSKLKWPAFVSPILFPNSSQTLPGGPAVQRLAPISAPAHPGTKYTSCAFLHPKDPSCARNFLRYWLSAFPPVLKFFTLIYGAFALLAYKALLKNPTPVLNRVSKRIIKMSLFITGAIGTSWGSICLFNNTLPRSFLPTQRWALGGFMGGMWAYAARNQERDNFMYSFRLSLDSFYKVGKKRGWWRGFQNGDVLLFVASLAAVNCIYESRPGAVQGAVIRKALGMLRGEGWVDRASKREAKKLREEDIVEEAERVAEEEKKKDA